MDRGQALKLLKGGREGVTTWNKSARKREPLPEMLGADLRHADLAGVNFTGVKLGGSDFGGAVLRDAKLCGADLGRTDLSHADLRGADLRGADLGRALIRHTNLGGADLRDAALGGAVFDDADLSGSDLAGAVLGRTVLANLDLPAAKGLADASHSAPSSIGSDTMTRSRGRITEPFLRGCGLATWEVLSARLYEADLSPNQVSELQYRIFDAWTKGRSLINGCFISYSWKDANFVDRLRERLAGEGINIWLDRHDMVAGNIQDQVWQAIQVYHVVIIVLSEAAIGSDWVESEYSPA